MDFYELYKLKKKLESDQNLSIENQKLLNELHILEERGIFNEITSELEPTKGLKPHHLNPNWNQKVCPNCGKEI